MRELTAIGLAALLACAACRSSAGRLGLETLDVESNLKTNSIVVVPGERYVLVQTAGTPETLLFHTGPRLLVWDRDFDVVARLSCDTSHVGASQSGTALLRVGVLGREVRSVPDLAVLATVGEPARTLWPLGSTWVLGRPDAAGWAVVGWGEVLRVDAAGPGRAEPRLAATARAAIGSQRSAAIDDQTGLLVMTDGESRAELFDLRTMATTCVVDLPCRAAKFDTAACAGRAWIATYDDDGDFLELDLTTRQVRRHPTGVRGRVRLALSPDGARLVTATQQFVRGGPHPTRLAVLRPTSTGLVPEASVDLELASILEDVAIVPSWGVVLLAGKTTFAWRYTVRAEEPRRERTALSTGSSTE